MPELPEVETIKRDLQRLLGENIERSIISPNTNIVKNIQPIALQEKLQNLEILNIDRVGKYLKLELQDLQSNQTNELIIHLGMSGQLYVTDSPLGTIKHIHLKSHLSNGATLVFRDPRRFGRIWWGNWKNLQAEGYISRLGPDLLSPNFTEKYLQSVLNRSRPVKTLLLDQTLLAGLGNIYADESLFKAKILPQRKGCDLKENEIKILYRSINEIINQSIKNKGTTLVDFIGGTGKQGKNQNYLQVYQRNGKPCNRCGNNIIKDIVGGRGTHYCPFCQK